MQNKLYLLASIFIILSSCLVLSTFAHRTSGPENEVNFIFSGMVPPSASSSEDKQHHRPPCPSPSCPPPVERPCVCTPCNACAPCTDFNLAGAEIVVGAGLAPFGLDPESQDRPGFGFEVVAEICARFNCKARFEMVKLSEILSLIDASTSNGNFNKFEKKINVLADQITVNGARDVFFDYSSVYAQAVQYLYVLPSATFASRDAFVADAKNKVGTVVGSVFIATANTLVGADRVVLYPDFVALTAALVNNDVQGILVATVTQLNTEVKILGAPAAQPNNLAMVWPENDLMRNIFNVGLARLESDGTLPALRRKYRLSAE